MRWLIALAVAALLHVVLFVNLDWRGDPGARAAGQSGLLVSLAPAGGDTGQPEVQPANPSRDPEPEPASESNPEAEATSEPESKPAPDPAPEPTPEPENEPDPQPDPRITEAEPDRSPPVSAVEPAAEPVRRPSTSTASAQDPGSRARAGADTAAVATDGSTGGGDPGVRSDYLARIQALLARHREYPRRARLRRMEGVVEVAFTIRPDGRLAEARVIGSSGHDLLDRAARELLARADPLPPFPEDMGREPINLELPIEYRLR